MLFVIRKVRNVSFHTVGNFAEDSIHICKKITSPNYLDCGYSYDISQGQH